MMNISLIDIASISGAPDQMVCGRIDFNVAAPATLVKCCPNLSASWARPRPLNLAQSFAVKTSACYTLPADFLSLPTDKTGFFRLNHRPARPPFKELS
jgi:hypothetical protein